MKTDPEIKALFAQYTGFNVTKRDDGVWVVDGSIDLSEQELVELPFKGITYEVTRHFHCFSNQLTSLAGAPQSVGKDFHCDDNQLTSLEGAPQSVGGHFWCHENQLTSLEGAPQEVGGYFCCYNNRLVTLYGAPKLVKGNFNASFFDKNGNGNIKSNPLVSLTGCPEEITGDLQIYNSNLVNFTGIARKIGGKILCDGNPLTSLDGLPEGWEEKLCDQNGAKLTTTLTRTTTNQTQGMQF